MDERASWDRRLDLHESGPAYHAFRHFRDLPGARSLARAYTLCWRLCPRNRGHVLHLVHPAPAQNQPETVGGPARDAPPSWRRWRRQFVWDARAADWDTFVA